MNAKKRKFKLTVALTLSIAMLLIATSCGSGPTLGNPKDGYDGFEYLKEESLSLGSDEKLQVFVPSGDNVYSKDDYVTSSGNGIEFKIQVVADSSVTASGDSLKKLLEVYGDLNTPDLNAAEESADPVELINDDSAARRQGFRSTEQYDKSFDGVCITEFVCRLENKKVVKGVVRVSSKNVTENTQKALDELTAFYKVDMYWDADKAKEAADKYTATPPATKKVYVGGFTTEIPRSWKQDYDSSTSSTYYYGPNGKATTKENLIVIYKYVGSSVSGDNVSEETYKSILKNLYPDMKVALSKTDTTVEGGTAFKTTMSKDGVTITGYYLFADNRLFATYTASAGKPSSDMQNVVDKAFTSMTKYSRAS